MSSAQSTISTGSVLKYLQQLGLLVCLLMGATTVNAGNCPEMPVDGHLYTIINYGSGAALDISGASREGGANVITWKDHGGANQHFYLRKTGDGYWTIQAAHSGFNLDVLNFSQSNGGNIIQWRNTGTANQQWLLKQSSLGAFNVVSRNSNKSLTVAGGQPGANVYQNSDTANSSQRWYFNPVEGNCGQQGNISGFASLPGNDGLNTTIGGGAARPVVVHSCDQLAAQLESDGKSVVHIPNNTVVDCHTPNRTQVACPIHCPDYLDNPNKVFYRIPVGSQRCTELGSKTDSLVNRTRNERRIHIKSNKTVIGLGPRVKVTGATFVAQNVENVIMRNFTIEDVNPALVEAGDGITLNDSSHVWLDHMKFRLISDGHVDIKNSRNLTLSWNHFDGYNTAVCGNQHHYTSLVQDSQITLDHNYWDRTSGRNPKMDGSATRAHLYNNYWRNITYFAINVDHGAKAELEANFFDNSARPHWNAGSGYLEANVGSNRYTGISATDSYKDTGARGVLSDSPDYFYQLDDVDSIPSRLKQGTGPQ